MKKTIVAITAAVAVMAAGSAAACPEWECQLDLNDYSCGGYHGGGCITQTYQYDEYSVRQPIYCQYCGHEQWDCICGTYSGGGCVDYDVDYNSGCVDYDYDCNDNYNYSCGGQMSHWANIRDCNGNIIGQAGCGDSVEVIGTDSSDSSRVLIYDRSTGCYGSVLASCVYGGYEWDGSGDNGYYNQYQGGCVNDWDYSGAYDCNDYYDSCGYADAVDCSGYSGGYQICAAYSTTTYTQIVQTIVEQVTYSMGLGFGGSCGFKGWC